MVQRTEKGVRRREQMARRTEKGVRRTEKWVRRTEIVLWGHRICQAEEGGGAKKVVRYF